jgi:hypothetical protein
VPYEVFDKRAAPSTKEPWVTIQKKGLLSLNSSSVEALGKPEAVELLFDPEEQKIGFRPTNPESPRSFPLRRQGRPDLTHPNYLIAGTAFCNYYGIDTSFARRYRPQIEDNILAVDLKQEYANASVRRKPRAKSTQGDTM